MTEQPTPADSTALITNLVQHLEPNGLVTKFVVVAEVLTSDGERVLWIDAHDTASKWDTYGLLTWALNEEVAGQLHTFTRDGDDSSEDD